LELSSINILGVSQNRGISNTIYQFPVSLNNASSSDVSVDYTTVAGTAIANKDFVPVSGTLTIPASSLTGNISVKIIGDSLRQANQTFTVQLSNPKNCTLIATQATGTIINEKFIVFPG